MPNHSNRSYAHQMSLAVAAFALIAAACGGDAHGETAVPNPPTPVRVASVSPVDAGSVVATGSFGAKDEIPLSFKVGGVIARLTVDEGDRVRAGQVLGQLDLREIDAAVAKATAAAEKGRRDAARVERLYRDSVATLAQWQDAQTARAVAEADLSAARMNREYAVIAAPTSGVVLERAANAGSLVSPGAQVLVLASAARGAVFRAGLPDRDVVRVRMNDAALVTFDAIPDREFRGVVRQVGADADPRTGTYTVEVSLVDATDLPNGVVGRARIQTSRSRANASTEKDIVAIPAEALVEGDGARGTLFVMDDENRMALKRTIDIVSVDGERVLVRGLTGATRVVTSGAAWLRDSTRVEVRP